MKKVLTLCLMMFAVVTLTFANGTSESSTSVKIGFIGPLTGDYANYGVRCQQAAELKINEVNAAGGINGSSIILISEDSEGSPEKAVACYEKLVNTDKVCCIVGPVLTGEAFAVAEKCQEDGILMISPSASHKDITNIGDFVFRTTPSDGLQGEIAGYYFANELGYKKIAVLYAKNDYSQGLYEGMKESFEKCGGKIIAVETCMVGDKDFKTQLTKIKQTDAEAIYIPNYTAEMAQTLEQAAQVGVKIPFLSGDGFTDAEIYNLAGDYTEGVIYIGPTEVEENLGFNKAFKDAYGVEIGAFSSNCYDATGIVIDAIKKAGTGRKAIRDAVAATKDYQGVLGTVNFQANGDLVANQGAFKVINKAPVSLGSFTIQGGKLEKVN